MINFILLLALIFFIITLLIIGHIMYDRYYHKGTVTDDRAGDYILKFTAMYLNGYLPKQNFVEFILKLDPNYALDIFDQALNFLKGSAIDLLDDVLAEERVYNFLIEQTKSNSADARMFSAELLSRVGGERATYALRDLLHDSRADVRFAATNGLIVLDSISFWQVLQGLQEDLSHRADNLFVIFKNMLPKYTVEIMEFLTFNVSDELKIPAIDALGQSCIRAMSTYIQLVEEGSTEIRLHALRAIEKLKQESSLPAIDLAIHDINWRIREEAAICAGKIGLRQMIPSLEELLGDKHWSVRFKAAIALMKIGSEGIDILKSNMESGGITGEISQQVVTEYRL